jgi:phage shock protein A
MTESSLEATVMEFLASVRPRVDRMTETAIRLRELQHESASGDPWREEIANLAIDTAAALTDIVVLLRPIVRRISETS